MSLFSPPILKCFNASGTAFFPLQSCMNHSCCPNGKAFKREEVI